MAEARDRSFTVVSPVPDKLGAVKSLSAFNEYLLLECEHGVGVLVDGEVVELSDLMTSAEDKPE